MTGTAETAEQETAGEPWNADRFAAVLTASVYEHFVNAMNGGRFTFCAHGRDEVFDLLDGEDDDDTLTFQRVPDGARFKVSFWVDATEVRGDD